MGFLFFFGYFSSSWISRSWNRPPGCVRQHKIFARWAMCVKKTHAKSHKPFCIFLAFLGSGNGPSYAENWSNWQSRNVADCCTSPPSNCIAHQSSSLRSLHVSNYSIWKVPIKASIVPNKYSSTWHIFSVCVPIHFCVCVGRCCLPFLCFSFYPLFFPVLGSFCDGLADNSKKIMTYFFFLLLSMFYLII